MEFYDGSVQGTRTQIDSHNLFSLWHRSGMSAESGRVTCVSDNLREAVETNGTNVTRRSGARTGHGSDGHIQCPYGLGHGGWIVRYSGYSTRERRGAG